MKKITRIIQCFLILIFLFVLIGIGFIWTQSQPVSKSKDSEKIRIEIPYGISVPKVAALLKQNNLIKNEKLFYYFARVPQLKKIFFSKSENISFVLRSGIYYISPNMNIAEIQNLLTSGQQEFVKVAIPEGLTISKIAAILEENRICNAQDFISACKNPEIIRSYGIPGETLEGYLFPETYFMNLDMDAEAVAKLFVDTFMEKIKSIENMSQMNNTELFETVTLASIVEREYRVADEAPLIASVFKNRIRINMGLYSCATVEYIITEIEGRPHPERIFTSDTQIDNPYNTYKWAGLPPGPISNPGIVALNAATNTPKTKYYYFRVADPAAGRHVFTTTFEDHIENNNLYTKKAAGK